MSEPFYVARATIRRVAGTHRRQETRLVESD